MLVSIMIRWNITACETAGTDPRPSEWQTVLEQVNRMLRKGRLTLPRSKLFLSLSREPKHVCKFYRFNGVSANVSETALIGPPPRNDRTEEHDQMPTADKSSGASVEAIESPISHETSNSIMPIATVQCFRHRYIKIWMQAAGANAVRCVEKSSASSSSSAPFRDQVTTGSQDKLEPWARIASANSQKGNESLPPW